MEITKNDAGELLANVTKMKAGVFKEMESIAKEMGQASNDTLIDEHSDLADRHDLLTDGYDLLEFAEEKVTAYIHQGREYDEDSMYMIEVMVEQYLDENNVLPIERIVESVLTEVDSRLEAKESVEIDRSILGGADLSNDSYETLRNSQRDSDTEQVNDQDLTQDTRRNKM